MKRGFVRSLVTWSIVGLLGCTAGAGGCGGCTEDIPGGFPEELRVTNAMSVKLSKDGIAFFENRVGEIIEALAGGLNFQVPCTDLSQSFDVPLINRTITLPVYLCDHAGKQSCTQSNAPGYPIPTNDPTKPTNPRMKQCEAQAGIVSLDIDPKQNIADGVDIKVSLKLLVNTGQIIADVITKEITGANWVCGDKIRCSVEFDSNASGVEHVPLNVNLFLTLSEDGDILDFRVEDIKLQDFVEMGDFTIAGSGDVDCSLICEGANISFVKNLIFDFAKNMLNEQVAKALDGFVCRSCDADVECPGTSTCQSNICMRGNKCVPILVGLEGRVNAGEMLASFGGSASSKLDLYAVAGGRNDDGKPSMKVENSGVVVGMMGGTRAVVYDDYGSWVSPGVAKCVPKRTFERRAQPKPVLFDQEAASVRPQITGYQLGLSLSDNFLDQALFDAYQSGLLCLDVDSDVSSFLSTSLFSTFLPSLGVLTGKDDVPMLVSLRPKTAPHIIVGKGTTKELNGQPVPDDPLLTVVMDDLQIDFYALLEGRFARLFSLRTDLRLPLSLEFTQDNKVQIVLADLTTLLTNTSAQNSEMLAEDPKVVADLIDAVIGLLQPLLADLLAPIELPEFSGFQIDVRKAMGVMPLSAQPGHEHLALFADLKLGGSMPYTASSRTEALLVEKFVPERHQLLSGARPKAVIDVSAPGAKPRNFAGTEYSWRVNGGLWSPWTTQTRLEVAAPVLVFQGRHFVEVRSREIGVRGSEDQQPAGLIVEVDYEAPTVSLRLDAERRVVVTTARDAVSRDDELRYSYRVSGGGWTSFGAPREFTLDELGANPSLEVEVVDAFGHKARTWFGEPAEQVDTLPNSPETAAEAGCASGGVSILALSALVLLLRRRRAF